MVLAGPSFPGSNRTDERSPRMERLRVAGLASLAFTLVGGLALFLGLALVNLHSH